MGTNSKKAYSYARMSTDAQLRGDSLRRQLEASRKYAEENDLELVEEIHDIGKSAFKGDHISGGAFGIFLKRVENGEIEQGSVLLVESLDRLSRENVMTAFGFFTQILAQKISIVTLVDGQTYTYLTVNEDPGKLFLSLGVMLRAYEESKTKSKRLKAVWQRKRSKVKSQILTKQTPAWIDVSKDGKKCLLNEAACKPIRMMFDMCINGHGYAVIVRLMNEKKIPTIGKSRIWNISYVKKLLSNRQLVGEFQPHHIVDGKRRPDGPPIEGYFPSVISEHEFYSAQLAIKARRKSGGGRKGTTYANVFQHLVKCGNCGSPMHIINKGAPPKGARYFHCRNALHGGLCKNGYWRYDKFETSFLQFTTGLDLHSVFHQEDQTKSQEVELQIDTLQEKLAVLTPKIQKNADDWTNAEDDVKEFLLSSMNTQVDEKRELEKQIEKLNDERIDFDWPGADSTKSSLIVLNERLASDQTDDDHFQTRSKLAVQLKKIVERIVLHEGPVINPWELAENREMEEFATERLLQTLGDDAHAKLRHMANTASGRRLLQRLDRTYSVIFKSGRKLHVHQESGTVFESRTPAASHLKASI